MTNNEVIAVLKDMQSRCTKSYDAEAIYCAIKALEEKMVKEKNNGNIG